MTERIIPIIRKEYKDASEKLEEIYRDPKMLAGTEEEQAARIREISLQKGRIKAVAHIVEGVNEEFGVNYRKDATRNPSRKKNT